MHPSPLTRWFPVLLWMGVIFWFSSMPELASGFPALWDLILRKITHMVEYALLAVLTMRAIGVRSQRTLIVTTLFLGVGYAVSDEIHQSFVSGREAAFTDVLIDGLGVLIGMGVWEMLEQSKRTEKRRSQQGREALPAKK